MEVAHLQREAKKVLHGDFVGVLPCESRHGGLYPNVDLSIWLRSCIQEIVEPCKGQLKGRLPSYLKGGIHKPCGL